MIRPSHALWTAILVVLLSGVGFQAMAASEIQVQLEIVKADRVSEQVDPGLEELAATLKRQNFAYTGFSLLKEIELSLASGEQKRLAVSEDMDMNVLFHGLTSEGKARVEVAIPEQKFSTVLLFGNRGSALIGGPAFDDGVLLIRITPTF